MDHVTSYQHKAGLIQVRKSCSDHITNYLPIAWSLLVIDDTVQERKERKFKKESYITALLSRSTLHYMNWNYIMVWNLARHTGANILLKYSLHCRESMSMFTCFSLDVHIFSTVSWWMVVQIKLKVIHIHHDLRNMFITLVWND